MRATPTTTVKILTGRQTTDEWGDPADNATVAASGVLASIIERQRTVFSDSGGNPRTLVTATGRVAAGVSVADEDRIQDEQTGTIYVVNSVTVPTARATTSDQVLDLQRVG